MKEYTNIKCQSRQKVGRYDVNSGVEGMQRKFTTNLKDNNIKFKDNNGGEGMQRKFTTNLKDNDIKVKAIIIIWNLSFS